MIDSTDFEGKFEFRPLEPVTDWPLVMHLEEFCFSALEGYAHLFVLGVDHEFSTISGVVEDVTEIILILNKYVSNVKLKISIMNQLLFLFQVKIN
jgi:DNA-directed RNA polymerase subunit alpha